MLAHLVLFAPTVGVGQLQVLHQPLWQVELPVCVGCKGPKLHTPGQPIRYLRREGQIRNHPRAARPCSI